MKKKIFIVAAIIAVSQAQAQNSTKTMDTVTVITANKFVQKQDQTGKVITIIGKDVIEKSVGKTVAQLLNEQAGITVAGSLNNLGTNPSLYVRGASTGRALVLVDGIPVNDPSLINNEFDLNLLVLNDIERIEICKGAQSTLYGSDAVAGVVNIITVSNNINKPVNAKATVSYGSLNTFKGNAQVFGKTKGLTYSVRYAKIKTDGFSSAYDSAGNKGFDDDGYNQDAVSGMLSYDFTKQFSARTFLQYSKYKTDIDASAFNDSKDFTSTNRNLITGFSLQYKSDAVSVTGNYQYSDIDRNLFDDSTDNPGYLSKQDYFGKSQFVEIFANIKLGKRLTLLQGADYRNNSMNMVTFGTYPASPWGPAGTYGSSLDSSISQSSIYASLLYNGLQNRVHVELGGRLNVNSRYGSNHTYTFTPSYRINSYLRVMGSISSAYKTPTVYQLYSSYGNPDLKVEESKSYEIGIQAEYKKVSGRLVYFYRDIDNGIDFDNNLYKYFNFNKQKVNGIEVEAKASPVKGLSINANYTYLTADENTQSRVNFKDSSYTYLLRRPKHSFNITAGYDITSSLFVSVGGKYVGERHDVGGYMTDDIQMPSYFILNAYASYTINSRLKVFADAQNLTDKKFFDINGYNSIPLLLTGGVTFNF